MGVIVSINICDNGSTGKIMCALSKLAEKNGYAAYMAYPDAEKNTSRENAIIIGKSFFRKVNRRICIMTGYNDCMSHIATYNFLKRLDKLKPSVLHLHNLHNCYLNMPMLFKYIKKNDIPVVWTLHDCWAFTGQCPHFTIEKCEKWRTGCFDCPQFNRYPETMVDKTKTMWKLKKEWFTGVKNMTIVTPSAWLGGLAKQSYLKEYPIEVINNGINTEIFKPIDSDFKKKYKIEDKKMVLGVAFGWDKRKGLDVFIRLAESLGDEYKVVLVGTDDAVDAMLPDNIISIHRTNNQQELAEIYAAADVLANPTREENYPTVNMEAIACGTPVITFKTGGSPEILDETCGMVVGYEDTEAMENGIREICTGRKYTKEACLKRAECFDENKRFEEYMDLYKSITGER